MVDDEQEDGNKICPTTAPTSIEINGLHINEDDLKTLIPGEMINDNIAMALLG